MGVRAPQEAWELLFRRRVRVWRKDCAYCSILEAGFIPVWPSVGTSCSQDTVFWASYEFYLHLKTILRWKHLALLVASFSLLGWLCLAYCIHVQICEEETGCTQAATQCGHFLKIITEHLQGLSCWEIFLNSFQMQMIIKLNKSYVAFWEQVSWKNRFKERLTCNYA